MFRITKVITASNSTLHARYQTYTWVLSVSKGDKHDQYDVGYCGCGKFTYNIATSAKYKIVSSSPALVYVNGSLITTDISSYEIELNAGDTLRVAPYMPALTSVNVQLYIYTKEIV